MEWALLPAVFVWLSPLLLLSFQIKLLVSSFLFLRTEISSGEVCIDQLSANWNLILETYPVNHKWKF